MEPFRTGDRMGDIELRYISPDCRFAITAEDVTSGVTRWRLFDGEKERQVTDSRYEIPFRIIKTEDVYVVINGETFDRIEDKLDAKTGYSGWLYNEQGDLTVGDKYNKLSDTWEMVICDLNSEEVLWTFHGKGFPELQQFQGDKESGKVVLRLDSRYFYELSYPSGDIKYLGKDMYCLSYSPDRKYVAYSEPCNEDIFDLNEEEYKEIKGILPGIYILEVETGKIAYIRLDIHDIEWAEMLVSRSFEWVEKDCFEKVMENQ